MTLKQSRPTYSPQLPSDPSVAGGPAPRVLVVDDDASLLRLLSTILRSESFEVATAANGQLALERLQAESFDVIVMDLKMPVLDGRGLFRELRARKDTTPVLIASAFGARQAQRELGAEASIQKPFDPDDLVATVQNLVGVAKPG